MTKKLATFPAALAALTFAATACGAADTVEAGAADTAVSRDASRGRTLFVESAVERGDGTVTLPLYRGTSQGQDVWYVVLDSSNGNDADDLGVNVSQKLANARGTGAVQKVGEAGGMLQFPATVDFREGTGVAEPGYTPLVELRDGTIRNAPHVANGTGQHPKVRSIDKAGGTVTLEETDGFSGGKLVHYVSTDASHPVAAQLEDVPLVTALNDAPTVGEDGTDSSRTSLAAFLNGRTGRTDPERQGIASAIADGLSPLNVLRWSPSQGRYSPLWDVHLTEWTQAAITAGQDLRQEDFGDIIGLAAKGIVTGPGGAPWGAVGIIVNCPIISAE